MSNIFLAHVKQDANGKWVEHPLEVHLRAVGKLASKMAEGFQSGDWAKAAGLWHDVGK